ncbi:MAG: tyrosine--tRNA ligase [Candidatus Bathyarchaeia archaeon]
MNLTEKLSLINRNVVEEIVTLDELKTLMESNSKPRAYWGFECSGMMHLGMGLICGRKIRDMIEAGFEFIIFLADWHSWINNKLGGVMENIRLCGEYFKQCFESLEIHPNKVKFIWASEIVRKVEYWEKVIKVAKQASLHRVWRALPIMGREMDSMDVEAAAIFYPCMQAADIFQMDLDVACSGLDQRKAHMLARDVAEKLKWSKPICVHTHLLMGLKAPTPFKKAKFDESVEVSTQIESKMSKSVPGSSILIHDSPEEIKKKIQSAYCLPKDLKFNPIMELAKYIIFPELKELRIERALKYGGDKEFKSYEELEKDYSSGKIHPQDLKNSVAESLIKLLEGVRKYFDKKPELLEEMKKIDITR